MTSATSFEFQVNQAASFILVYNGKAREEMLELVVFGERRWVRVLRVTCLGEEATNLLIMRSATETSPEADEATEVRKRWPCFVRVHCTLEENGGECA